MPLLNYNFHPDIFRDQKIGKLGVVYRPYVLIKIGNGTRWSENFIRALVDSGADRNVFPALFATEIGIDYVNGEQKKIVGVGKQDITSYTYIVKMKIDTKEFDTVIEFGESIQIPLLGREGFMNYFDYIKFNVKKKVVELKY